MFPPLSPTELGPRLSASPPATDPHLIALTRRAIARKRGERTRPEVLLADVAGVVERAAQNPWRALQRYELVALRHDLGPSVRAAAEAEGANPLLAAVSLGHCFAHLGVARGGQALIDAALDAVGRAH